jgi:hypothetical protein
MSIEFTNMKRMNFMISGPGNTIFLAEKQQYVSGIKIECG